MNLLKTVKFVPRCLASPSILPSVHPSSFKFLQPSRQWYFRQPVRSYREPLPCYHMEHPDKKPCFDIRNITIERGSTVHSKIVRSFLYTQYWPREPTVCGLWMSLDSPYLAILSDKYSQTGDRFLAFERQHRTNEKNLVGVLVANSVLPWMIDELEEWGHNTCCKPDKYRMYFHAHCLRDPQLFKKYNTGAIYCVDILGTSAEVTGQGVATQLLRTCLDHAYDIRHPLVQVNAFSKYAWKVCERCGMKHEWSMRYSDYVDDAGLRVFYPRPPHHVVNIYTARNDPTKGGTMPCKEPF